MRLPLLGESYFLLCSQMPEAKDHNCAENQKIDLPEPDC